MTLREVPRLQPVRIMAGVLGNGLPKRDLVVSRQHRDVVSCRITRRIFGTQGVIIPAVKLTELPGIYAREKHPDIMCFHILLDCHEAIRAEGVHCESLYLADEAKNTFSTATLNEISTIFPGFFGSQPFANLAMPTANGRFATNLIQRHVKNRMPLQDPVYTTATGDSPLDDRQL